MLEHSGDATVDPVGDRRLLDLTRPDHRLLIEQTRRREFAPVGEPVLAQQPQDAAVNCDDPAVGVAKRARLEAGHCAGRLAARGAQLGEPSSSGFPMWSSRFTRRQ